MVLEALKWIKRIFLAITCFLISCDAPQEKEFQRGMERVARGEFREATIEFERAMKRLPGNSFGVKAARENARIYTYEIKNYQRAIDSLKYLILYSDNSEERWRAQSQIAQIYFDNLGRYDKALIEYGKLLTGQLPNDEVRRVKLAIARSYYYLGRFDQSWSEISDISLDKGLSEELTFDILLLQANIHLALKKHVLASQALQELLRRYPERSQKENVGLNLVVCYEELGLFKEALAMLEQLKVSYEPKEYIDLRVRKIKDRLFNAPRQRLKK